MMDILPLALAFLKLGMIFTTIFQEMLSHHICLHSSSKVYKMFHSFHLFIFNYSLRKDTCH